MNSVAHPACGNAKHPAQLSTAQKADRRARRYIHFHAFQSEEKQDARQTQEFKNSRIQGVQEFRRQIPMSARINTGSNTSLIGWKPVNHRPYGRPILQLLTSEFLPL